MEKDKMVMNHVEVITREMVKPSSPTPHHLCNLKLSFLDQIAPPVYFPLIFFYEPKMEYDIDRAQKSQLLKQSLSDTLTRFYPLAGRIKNDVCIDCNDAGVEYTEAQVHAQLLHVIENPSMEELNQYLPIESYGTSVATGREALLAIQINFFDCGGLVIGLYISHIIADGSSLVTFTKAWAATARGAIENVIAPSFDLAFHFPPRDLLGFMPTTGITREKIVTRRFVFDKMKLATLKEAASSAFGSHVKDPTRVEAVSALIWSHLIDVAKSKLPPKNIFVATHAVNLRSRMNPPLPEQAFGNLSRFANALSMEGEIGFGDLVSKLRSAIRKIDSDYVKGLQIGDGYLDFLKGAGENFSKRELEYCNFSSWCRFPVYEVDYGWGKPVWVCTTTLPFKNVIILMSTSCGEGIEAWINMLEDDMIMLERDHNLLSLDATKINA